MDRLLCLPWSSHCPGAVPARWPPFEARTVSAARICGAALMAWVSLLCRRGAGGHLRPGGHPGRGRDHVRLHVPVQRARCGRRRLQVRQVPGKPTTVIRRRKFPRQQACQFHCRLQVCEAPRQIRAHSNCGWNQLHASFSWRGAHFMVERLIRSRDPTFLMRHTIGTARAYWAVAAVMQDIPGMTQSLGDVPTLMPLDASRVPGQSTRARTADPGASAPSMSTQL